LFLLLLEALSSSNIILNNVLKQVSDREEVLKMYLKKIGDRVAIKILVALKCIRLICGSKLSNRLFIISKALFCYFILA